MESILNLLGADNLLGLGLKALPFVLGIGIIWKYLSKALGLLKEVGELMIVVAESLEDKKLTAEEMAVLKKELADVISKAKAVFK